MAGLVNLTTLSNNFKIKYGKMSDDTFDSSTPLQGRIKVVSDFVGATFSEAVPTGFTGSVGAGELPEANAEPLQLTSFGAKKVYGRMKIDRESVYASKGNEGAFVELLQHQTAGVVKSFSRYMECVWMGDGTGALGTIDTGGVSTVNSTTYDITISAATWIEANFEEKDYVNIEAGNTDRFEVTVVTPSTRVIRVVRISGSQVPAQGDVVYMQGAYNAVPQGLKGVINATSGSKYGITIGRRWQSYQLAAGGVGISVDLMNNAVLELRRRCGQNPTMILTSFTQFRKYLNLLEDQKRYGMDQYVKVNARRSNFGPELNGVISYTGLTYMTSTGPIPVFESRFCPADTMYFLNDNYIKQIRRKGFGWFDDDGTVIMRMADNDAYEARYGGYLENYIMPPFQAQITGLAT